MRHGWKHGRTANPWPYAAVGVVVILAVIVGLKALEPAPVSAAAATDASKSVANNDPATLGSGPNNFKTVQHVLEQRCYHVPRCRPCR